MPHRNKKHSPVFRGVLYMEKRRAKSARRLKCEVIKLCLRSREPC